MYIFYKYRAVMVLLLAICFFPVTRICSAGEKIEGKVNINTAAESQISLLPGVGPKLAVEIVNYRTNNGKFTTVEDIKKIKGVGDKKFEKMKDYIVVEGDTTIQSTKMAKAGKEPKQNKEK